MEYRSSPEDWEKHIERKIKDIQSIQRRETEEYLRYLCVDRYADRQNLYWNRNYSSIEEFLSSVEENRRRWQEAVGLFEPEGDFTVAEELFWERENIILKYIRINFSQHLYCRGILGLPRESVGRLPLVIAQHGLVSFPERVFGFLDPTNLYHSYEYRLLEEGFAVLAPLNITEVFPRARYQRICLLLGKTIAGLEISKLKHLLDYVLLSPEIDKNRVGMWGISLGGFYTLITLPIENRIKLGIISAFFNHRLKKMVIDDPRYSCFLSTAEEHIFIPGWLREFTDSDLVSLICPRPLLIQTGEADEISWWPFVLEEFYRAKEHYTKLNIGDRIQIDLHSGGHEIRYESGLAFLKKWLF